MTTVNGIKYHKTQCAFCGKDDAVLWFGGCMEGAPGIHILTFYCNKSCQTSHWSEHKATCHLVPARKDLYRAGDILQEIFYTYREKVFFGEVTKVEEKDGKLMVYFRLAGPPGLGLENHYPGLLAYRSFPEDLVENIEDKHSILALQACDVAMALMHGVIKLFLDGLYKDIYEVSFEPNIKREIVIVDIEGVPEIENYQHAALQITLRGGGVQYMMDLSGAQFGHHQAVTTFMDYKLFRTHGQLSQHPFGISKATVGKEPPKDDAPGDSDYHFNWVVGQEASKCMLSTTKDWLKDNKMSVKELLRLKPEAYESSKKSLLEKLQLNILAVMRSMGTHYIREMVRVGSLGVARPYTEVKHFKFGE